MLLTGRAPFKADNIASLAYQVLNINPPLPSEFRRDVPLELDMIVIRALQRETEKRYQTWGQVIDELAALMQGKAALPTHPNVRAWYGRLAARPAYQEHVIKVNAKRTAEIAGQT